MNTIKIKSAHTSNKQFEFKSDTIPQYSDILVLCRNYFKYDGYLVIVWDGDYKTCLNEKDYSKASKYVLNNERVFYLERSCVKKN